MQKYWKVKSETELKRTIPIAKPILGKEEEEALKEVLESGVLTKGKKVGLFEKEFAKYVGMEHAITVVNGTIALDIVLKALGVGPRDEVVTPAFSFISSSNCVLYQGAKPIFADIDPRSFNIDPSEVIEKITSKTRAIIAVHLFGQPAEMNALKDIAEDHEIALVEDAAQAHGAEYKGRKVGGLGDVACFSFYATKNMTTGEGGMITTNDRDLARRAHLLRDHGQSRKYHHVTLGYNYRMTEICAALGLVQLTKLDGFNKRRRANAELLTRGVNTIPSLTPPHVKDDVKHVFSQYVVRVEDRYPMDRDELIAHLSKKGVDVDVHYPTPIYRQPFYEELDYGRAVCPMVEETCKRVLSLPIHPFVTKGDIKYMLSVLEDVAKSR